MPVEVADKFSFDEEFQKGIIRLMYQSPNFFISATDIIKPEYFENTALAWFFQKFRNFFIDYGEIPSMEVVKEEIKKAWNAKIIKDSEKEYYIKLYSTLKEPVQSSKYVVDSVVDFCRQQAIKKAFMKNVNLIDANDPNKWNRIQQEITEACNVGTLVTDLGIQYFEHFKERIRQRNLEEYRIITQTGIPQLDHLLNGGLKSGQIGFWLAPIGAGKSTALVGCGKRAILSGFKVLHYTFELRAEDIATRYDATFSHIPIWDLDLNVNNLVETLGTTKEKYNNSLVIKYYPAGTATVATLKAHIAQLKAIGWEPDVIVIDYIDLLKCSRQYEKKYDELEQLAIEVTGLAGELDVPLWTATQGNRGSVSKQFLDTDDVAGAFAKLMPADVVIGLKRDRDDKVNDHAVLTLIKNRNGPDGVTLEIDTDYSRMLLYVPGPSSGDKGGKPDNVS